MDTHAVQTIELTKDFGDKLAVNKVSLSVAQGEFFGFLGPNGAGKSTTIKMLVGLLRPTSGSALINGTDVWSKPLEAKAQIGVVPEGLNLYERLTGREFVRFAGTVYGLDEKQVTDRTEELLDVLDLQDDAEKMIVDYSHGMQKKVALASAIIHAPRVLFLDEPFEGIDALAKRVIRDVLDQLRSRGTTIFFSSHILEVVERLCTRVAVIAEGVIVADGSLAELRARADTGADATLEEIFLRAVGADEEEDGKLSWLE